MKYGAVKLLWVLAWLLKELLVPIAFYLLAQSYKFSELKLLPLIQSPHLNIT